MIPNNLDQSHWDMAANCEVAEDTRCSSAKDDDAPPTAHPLAIWEIVVGDETVLLKVSSHFEIRQQLHVVERRWLSVSAYPRIDTFFPLRDPLHPAWSRDALSDKTTITGIDDDDERSKSDKDISAIAP